MIARTTQSSTMLFLSIFCLTLPHSLFAFFFNQPKFSPCASWNATAITFATNESTGFSPNGIFVDGNNTVYVVNRPEDRILIWYAGSNNVSKTLTNDLNRPLSIFVLVDGDIYISNGHPDQIKRFRWNSTTSEILVNLTDNCVGLFIDLNDTVYCVIVDRHYVVKKSLKSMSSPLIIAAGNGTNGTGSYLLDTPRGIFVDDAFNLYVADKNNDRIQRFPCGQLNATTIVGNTVPGTITLYFPVAVIFDPDDYIFITDSGNHRIIGSGPFGFRCIVGCIGQGSTADQMDNPQLFYFDTYGNIFVIDRNNDRVQKFFLASNYCGELIDDDIKIVYASDY